MIKAPPLFQWNRGSGQSRLDTAPDTPGTLRNELVKSPNASAPLAESRIGNTADHQNQAVGVRRLETLRQFHVNLFGFSTLDVKQLSPGDVRLCRKRAAEQAPLQTPTSQPGIGGEAASMPV